MEKGKEHFKILLYIPKCQKKITNLYECNNGKEPENLGHEVMETLGKVQ